MRFSRVFLTHVCVAFVVGTGPTLAQNNTGKVLDIMREVIRHGNQQPRPQPQPQPGPGETYAPRPPGVSAAQRQQNRDVQTALNSFGFNAGRVDGSLGRQSQRAIGDLQQYMGRPPTGYLNDWERGQLIDSWRRYQSGGGNAYPEVMARDGVRGLLKAFNDPNYAAQARAEQQTLRNSDQEVQTQQQPITQPRADFLTENDAIDDGFSIPDLNFGSGQTSIATYCDLVAGISQASGGPTLPGSVTDPEQALGEQFCEARAFAITESQSLLSKARKDEDQLAGLCDQVTAKMSPSVSGLNSEGLKFVIGKAQEITGALFKQNMNAAASYGKICLGIGYRQDKADMALAGATVLVAAGQPPYGEMVGHHLQQGFGTGKSSDQADNWFELALTSMEQGEPPVFLPSKMAERNQIIRAAISMQTGVSEANGNDLTLPALDFN